MKTLMFYELVLFSNHELKMAFNAKFDKVTKTDCLSCLYNAFCDNLKCCDIIFYDSLLFM